MPSVVIGARGVLFNSLRSNSLKAASLLKPICHSDFNFVAGSSPSLHCPALRSPVMICVRRGTKMRIKINEQDAVTAIIYPANRKSRANVSLLLGHGAGRDQTSNFMVRFGEGLAARGIDVVTF